MKTNHIDVLFVAKGDIEVHIRVVVEAGTSETETWVAKTKTETI